MTNSVVQVTGGVLPKMADENPVLEGIWTKGTKIPESAGIEKAGSGVTWAKVGQRVYIFSMDSTNTYIYDIPGDVWTATERMPTPRRHMATVAVGEKIYCIGGQLQSGSSWEPSPAVEIFDTTANIWSTGVNMPVADYLMAYLQWENRIYCFGGSSHETTTLQYDIEADSWEKLEDAPSRKDHDLVKVMLDNKVYWANGRPQDNFEIFDLETGRWSTGSDIPTRRNGYSFMAVRNERIYCIAGNTTAVGYYDTVTRLWHGAAPKPTSDGYGFLLQRGGIFYCLGAEKAFEVYDTASNTWQVAQDIPNAINTRTPVFLQDNKIYCVGNTQNMEVDIFQLEESPEHLIRVSYLSAQGTALLEDGLWSVQEGDRFSVTAPSLRGYTLLGYRLDGSELKSGGTVTLEEVADGHGIAFVYQADDDGGNGPGDNGNGGDGQSCKKCGCHPCCCGKYNIQFHKASTTRETTVISACSEGAALRMAKALRDK